MKSQINLYHKEFHPTFEVYKAQNLGVVSVLSLVLVAIIFGGVLWIKQRANESLAQAQESQLRTQARIEEIQAELMQRTSNPVLLAKLSEVKQDMGAQRKLVAQIQALSGMKDKTFSGLFDAFSKNSKQNLWLTSFTVNENDLVITGELSAPQALPGWISDLNNLSYFYGQEFDDARVERKDNVLTFVLTSHSVDAQQRLANGSAQGGSNGN